MNKEAYLCLSAMLRARETRMLTADRAARMLEASGFEESVKLLADCGYEDLSGLNAAGIDAALSERRAAILSELENLVPDKALVELFRLKYDYHNAKAVLKGEAMGVETCPPSSARPWSRRAARSPAPPTRSWRTSSSTGPASMK